MNSWAILGLALWIQAAATRLQGSCAGAAFREGLGQINPADPPTTKKPPTARAKGLR